MAATTLTVRVFGADLTGRQELGYGVVELGEDWSLLKNHPAKVRAGLLFTEDTAVHMYVTVNVNSVLAISECDSDGSGEPRPQAGLEHSTDLFGSRTSFLGLHCS